MKKEELKRAFQKLIEPKGEKSKKSLNIYFYLLLGLGIAIMLLSNMTSTFQTKNEPEMSNTNAEESEEKDAFANRSSNPSTIVEYEEYYERQVRDILADVIGVSNVSVKVNIASTEKKLYEKNRRNEKQVTEENDREGGTRTIENHSMDEETIIVRDGDKDKPVIIGSEKPKVTGVIVVAQGAESMQVKQQIIEAVTRFLHVPSYQVSVLPKKIKED